MYVWFDALNIYQSGVGFGSTKEDQQEKYKKWWPADLHVIGKGIIRFHAVYWPAFLLSAGLKLPKALFVHGYFTVNGQKMSKSLGNVADPLEFIQKYTTDGLRYYLLRNISPTGDGDFSEKKLVESYNADLANGLGNLISRVAKLCENANFQKTKTVENQKHVSNFDEDYKKALDGYKFNDALSIIWGKISRLDKFINDEKPWDLAKNQNPRLKSVLEHAVDQIQEIGGLLKPLLPETAEKIIAQFSKAEVKPQPPLFPRISA
jgi:methionyl-tRNA synthetase